MEGDESGCLWILPLGVGCLRVNAPNGDSRLNHYLVQRLQGFR